MIFFRIDIGQIFCESRLTSAKIGFAPALTIEETEAIKVLGVTITSSPVDMFSALNALSKARVPLAKATAYFVSHQLANSC